MNAEVSRGEEDLRGGQGWIGEGLGTQVGLKRFEGLEVQFREALKSPHASLSLLNIPTIPVFFRCFPRALLICKCLIKTVNVIIAHYHISPN